MPLPKPINEMRFRVMAEYTSSGIWAIGQVGPFRHCMIEHKSIMLPKWLAYAFNAWMEWYEDNLPAAESAERDIENYRRAGLPLAPELQAWIEWYWYDPQADEFAFDVEKFNKQGLWLARQLKAFLGPDVYVEFDPEPDAAGLRKPQEIRLDTE